jgi:hypothetical protein
MHVPDFHELKFSHVEGCCDVDAGGRLVQYVRISLHANNTRREGSIPKLIEQYNRMEGRSETITPVVFFPQFQTSPLVCFKSRAASNDANPILKRIAQKGEVSFWRWVASASKRGPQCVLPSEPLPPPQRQGKRSITSIHDILRGLRLPESVVSVQRVYDELSEPYFRQFNLPLGEGTGCVPLEHRDFIVSEIRRLFEEELSYIQQPPAVGALPMHARALVENAGWMGDILLSGGEGMDSLEGGSVIRAVRAANDSAIRRFTRTGQTTSDQMEARGVGHSLREFLVFYALQWNDSGVQSVCQSVEALHAGWRPPLETLAAFRGLVVGISLRPCVVLEDGALLRVPSVERLVKLLCDEGLLRQVTSSGDSQNAPLQRMVVREGCKPVMCIKGYFQQMMLKEWVGKEVVEVSATDVVRVLNGGEVGVYRRSCVAQFMRPYLFDGSVEGYSWKGAGGTHCEKFIVHVARLRCEI